MVELILQLCRDSSSLLLITAQYYHKIITNNTINFDHRCEKQSIRMPDGGNGYSSCGGRSQRNVLEVVISELGPEVSKTSQ